MSDAPKGSLPPPELVSLLEAAANSDELGTENEPVIEVKPPETAPKTEEAVPETTTDGPPKETEKKPEEKPKSKYAQEQERKNRTWQEINAEKAALAEEKARIAREKEEVRIAAVKSQPFRDEHGHTAEAYEAFAEQAEKTGDKVNADAARKAAQSVREQETSAKQKASQQDLQSKWAENYNQLATANPDLKNKDSELYKAVVGKLDAHKLLLSDPSGINLAVEAVLIERKHKEIQSVAKENETLKKQIETLNKKLSLSSAVGAEPPKADDDFNKLSDAEKQHRIIKLMEQEAAT